MISYHKGTPKTGLEAMAIGRFIITTNTPGCKETVVEGFNGYLVPVNYVDSLIEKMTNLIKHPNLNISMAEYSLSIVREKYDVKKVNQSTMRIIEDEVIKNTTVEFTSDENKLIKRS